MMIKKSLRNLGLTDKEIAIYLALLPLGRSQASVLGYRTNIGRSMARYLCQQLVKKGICRVDKQENTLIFSPEPLDKLIFIFDEKQKALEEEKSQFNRVVGQLQSMINPDAVLPKMKFYEGFYKVSNAYFSMLNIVPKGEEILEFSNPADPKDHPEVYAWVGKWTKERPKRKIPIRIIMPDTNIAQQYKSDIAAMRETRFISSQFCNFAPSQINICENRVFTFYLYLKSMYCYELEHDGISDMYRKMFETAWAFAGK